ncbi:MAG: undecaprenyl-phosphate glucose phosphotransferase [Hyphomicrobiaceae bacterium]
MNVLLNQSTSIRSPVEAGKGAAPAAIASMRAPLVGAALTETASLISPVVVAGTVRMIEFVLLMGLGLALASIYLGDAKVLLDTGYIVAVAAAAGATTLVYQSLGLYRIAAFSACLRNLPRLLGGWGLGLGMMVAAVFFFKAGIYFSRVWLALWFVTGGVMIVAARLLLAGLTRRWAREGRLNRRAVIYGGGDDCEQLLAALEHQGDCDVRVCGVFDDRGEERVRSSVKGYPKLGNVEDLLAFTRKTRIDLLIVSLPLTAERRLLQLLKRLWVLPLDIRLAAHSGLLRFRPRSYSYIGNVPFLDLADKPIVGWDVILKWLFDKVFGVLALVLLAPVMAVIALAIRLDSGGPILFRQKRYGFNNELIEVFKFRSMYVDKCDANAAKLVTRGDARVTRVGRFIRRTSLDELPQLINVLRGELSLVGPRPHALEAKAADRLYQDVVDGYFARHKVKPGITGWAQINGWRGETDTPEKIQKRVEHDIYYIENWSVFLDLLILIRTPFALIRGDNAY